MYGIKICCICGQHFKGYGNNPDPVVGVGRCCDPCNREKIHFTRGSERICKEVRATIPTIDIFASKLIPIGSIGEAGNYGTYQLDESIVVSDGRRWHGDIVGYIMNKEGYGEEFVILDDDVTNRYYPLASVIVGELNGRPLWVYWPKGFYEDSDEEEEY